MIERISRIVLLSGVFFIPIIPLINAGSFYFPFITGKAFAFRIIVELIAIAWLVLAVKDPAYRPARSWIMWAFGIFVGVMGLATIFGENPLRSFWSNFERMEGFVTLLHLLALFFVLVSFVRTEKLWRNLFSTSVVVSVCTGFYVLMQMGGLLGAYTPGMRLSATFGNPSYLAVYLLIHVFITAWLLYQSRQTFMKVLFGCAMALQLFSLYQTATRGSILGVVGGFLLTALLIALFGKAHPRVRRVSMGIVALIVLTVGILFSVRGTDFVKKSPVLSRFATISVTETTTESRLILWKDIAWEGFKERPILGWGQDNFIHVFGKYYEPKMYRQEPWFDRAHNVFLDWLVAGGALGLLSYLALFFVGVFLLWKTKNMNIIEKSLFTGLFAGYFFHNLFVFDNLVSYILFVMLLAFIHVKNTENNERILLKDVSLSSGAAQGFQIAIIVAGLLVVYITNVPLMARAQNLIATFQSKDINEIYNTYDGLLGNRFLGKEEVREQMAQMALRVIDSTLPQDSKKMFVDRAIAELTEQTVSDPGNTRPFYFLGILLSNAGGVDQAVSAFDTALAMNPDRQITLFEKGMVLRDAQRYQESFEVFKHAFEVAPAYDDARLQYIIAANLVHNLTVVKEQVAYIHEQATAGSGDADAHFLIGKVYVALGQPTLAITSFEKAIELNADFAEQGNAYIEAIRAGKVKKIE